MLALAKAPFDTAATESVSDHGACGPCPERTGNQPGLFADVADDSTCTNMLCWEAKSKAQFLRNAERDRVKVLPKKKTEDIFKYGIHNPQVHNTGLALLSAPAPYHLTGGKHDKTVKDVLKKAGIELPPVTRAFHEGQTFELVNEKVHTVLDPLVKAAQKQERAKHKAGGPAVTLSQQERDRKKKAQLANGIAGEALRQAVEAWPDKPTVELLRAVAEVVLHGCWSDTRTDAARMLGLQAPQAKTTKTSDLQGRAIQAEALGIKNTLGPSPRRASCSAS